MRIVAHESQDRWERGAGVGAGQLAIESIVEPLAVKSAVISDYLHRSTATGDHRNTRMPVFLPQSVLTEMEQLTRAAGDVETGGVLIGHVCHDHCVPELFLAISAQISAAHARQAPTSLELTPETWSAVEAARTLRGLEEMQLGWWHYHPSHTWCRECPPEKRRSCPLQTDFFSEQDIAVHRTCFPRALSVAVVITDRDPEGLSSVMYGWQDGVVRRRGFYVLDG